MSLLAGDPRHGTESAYKYHGCRCDACRTATNCAQRERNRNRQPRTLLVRDERHGTTAGYEAGCRCDPCHEARLAYKRARSSRTLLVHDERHGTTAGYEAGCRCDLCRAARAAYKRECRLRKATAS